MRKVRATQRIKHNGDIYNEGDVLVVDNATAKRLEAYDAVEKKERKEEVVVVEETKAVDYAKMSAEKVVKIAKERGVAGASKLSKKDLVKILTDQDTDGEVDETATKEEGKE